MFFLLRHSKFLVQYSIFSLSEKRWDCAPKGFPLRSNFASSQPTYCGHRDHDTRLLVFKHLLNPPGGFECTRFEIFRLKVFQETIHRLGIPIACFGSASL